MHNSQHSGTGATPRDPTLDVMRGIGMILVIQGHFLEAMFLGRPDGVFLEPAFLIWKQIYAFHMPLFFLVAGAAAKVAGDKPWRAVVADSGALVLFAWGAHAVGVVLSWAIDKPDWSFAAVVWDIVSRLHDTSKLSVVTMWFLVVLAQTRLIHAGIAALPRRWHLLGWAAAIGASYAASWHLSWFSLKALPAGLFFFMVGSLVGLRPFTAARSAVAFGAIGAAALLLPHLDGGCVLDLLSSCPADPLLQGRHAVWVVGGRYGNMAIFLASALLGILVVAHLATAVRAAPRVENALAAIGRRSLGLFVVNGLVLLLVLPRLRDVASVVERPLVWGLAFLTLGLAAHLLAERLVRAPLERALASLRRACSVVIGVVGAGGAAPATVRPSLPSR